MTTTELNRQIDQRIDERLASRFADVVEAIGAVNESHAAIEQALEANGRALKAIAKTQRVLHEAILRLRAG